MEEELAQLRDDPSHIPGQGPALSPAPPLRAYQHLQASPSNTLQQSSYYSEDGRVSILEHDEPSVHEMASEDLRDAALARDIATLMSMSRNTRDHSRPTTGSGELRVTLGGRLKRKVPLFGSLDGLSGSASESSLPTVGYRNRRSRLWRSSRSRSSRLHGPPSNNTAYTPSEPAMTEVWSKDAFRASAPVLRSRPSSPVRTEHPNTASPDLSGSLLSGPAGQRIRLSKSQPGLIIQSAREESAVALPVAEGEPVAHRLRPLPSQSLHWPAKSSSSLGGVKQLPSLSVSASATMNAHHQRSTVSVKDVLLNKRNGQGTSSRRPYTQGKNAAPLSHTFRLRGPHSGTTAEKAAAVKPLLLQPRQRKKPPVVESPILAKGRGKSNNA